ncbi:hypothetical protein H7A76_17565 [Pseudomonas sp. MSSRFD41]|nr:hypothetical protein [Pseudomonas sp. MSSRFD41]MBC2657247.1 hypothetical protein [Pseudomonas sp. MSSRFD41]
MYHATLLITTLTQASPNLPDERFWGLMQLIAMVLMHGMAHKKMPGS